MGFFSGIKKSFKKALGLNRPDMKIPEPPPPPAADLVNPNLEADEELESDKERASKAARSGKSSLRVPKKGAGTTSNSGGASSATGTNI